MLHISYQSLKEKTISEAKIEAISLNLYGLSVVIDGTVYHVLGENERPLYTESLRAMKALLKGFYVESMHISQSDMLKQQLEKSHRIANKESQENEIREHFNQAMIPTKKQDKPGLRK